MPAQRCALVIGGSMSGLMTALMLRRTGWQVDVFERSRVELTGRGAGIVTQPELRQALDHIGLTWTSDLGIDVSRRVALDREGRVIAQAHCPQIATSWNRLFDLLSEGLQGSGYHLGRDLAAIGEERDGVTATFDDGSTVSGDLLVGADGFRSTVREHFLPQVQPLYAGYVAWRGLVEESALSEATRRDIFETFAFSLPEGEQMLGYPVAGEGNDTRPGRRRYNFVWYRPADERHDLPRLLTDRNGRHHAVSIPPPLIAQDVLDEMRAHAEQVFSPQFREVVRLTEQPFLQPIYDLESPQMAFGRVAILGDAAFVARPHVGAGASKAADDAAALARALDGPAPIEDALQTFAAERLAVGRRIVDQARRLGSYMRCEVRSEAERRALERHWSPQAVLAETALLDFLHA